jgi:CheY-like chemotaxis protein
MDNEVVKFDPGTKVMVVEDDKFIADLLVKKLSSCGASVTYVNNGEDVMKTLEAGKPDIAIFDVLLPGMDGFTAVGKIRSDEILKDLPVIFLSNMQSREDIERGARLGAANFLIKSMLTINEIIAEVKKVLDKSKQPVQPAPERDDRGGPGEPRRADRRAHVQGLLFQLFV